jgi:beta-xylosidase
MNHSQTPSKFVAHISLLTAGISVLLSAFGPHYLTLAFASTEPDKMMFNASVPELPESLQVLRVILSKVDKIDPAFIRKYLAQATHPVQDVHRELDELSSYYLATQKLDDPAVFAHQEQPSRFSGASARNVRVLKDPVVQSYLENLFQTIVDVSKDWNVTQLNRSDLFHAHMIYNQNRKDLLLVFHAKEYLNGEPSIEPGLPRRKLLEFFHEMPAEDLTVTSSIPGVTRRNFVWSLSENKIYGVDTTQSSNISFAAGEESSTTLEANKLSDLGSDGEIANLNYFPKEGVPLFLDFHRGVQ